MPIFFSWFGADFFTVYADFSRLIRDINGEKKKLVIVKNLLMPLFLVGCFPRDFQEVKRLLRTKSVKRSIKVGKRPINKGKRPIKAKVLVGVSVGCLIGPFRAPPPWRKTAPVKRPIKRSMILMIFFMVGFSRFAPSRFIGTSLRPCFFLVYEGPSWKVQPQLLLVTPITSINKGDWHQDVLFTSGAKTNPKKQHTRKRK